MKEFNEESNESQFHRTDDAEKTLIDIEYAMKKRIDLKNRYVREFLAEMFGTALLVLVGCASVAQYKLHKEDAANNPIFLTVNLTFGFGLTLAILITSKVSGGHLNPAVSFATLLVGKMSLLRFLLYLVAQFIGAFVGSAFVYVTYMDALKSLPNMYTLEYAGIFATYPRSELSVFGGVFDQAIGTFLLITVYLAMIDRRNNNNNSDNNGLHWTHVAFAMGLAVTIIGMSFGYNTGYAINPARDFSPRLFTLIAGWGTQVFTAANYFFWIPLCAPMIGSLVATILYVIFINNSK